MSEQSSTVVHGYAEICEVGDGLSAIVHLHVPNVDLREAQRTPAQGCSEAAAISAVTSYLVAVKTYRERNEEVGERDIVLAIKSQIRSAHDFNIAKLLDDDRANDMPKWLMHALCEHVKDSLARLPYQFAWLVFALVDNALHSYSKN